MSGYIFPDGIHVECSDSQDYQMLILKWVPGADRCIRYDVVMTGAQFQINDQSYDYFSVENGTSSTSRILDSGGIGSYTDNTVRDSEYEFIMSNRPGDQRIYDSTITDRGGETDKITIRQMSSTPESAPIKVAVEGSDLRLTTKKGTFLIKDQLANNGSEIEVLHLHYADDDKDILKTFDLREITLAAQQHGESDLLDLITRNKIAASSSTVIERNTAPPNPEPLIQWMSSIPDTSSSSSLYSYVSSLLTLPVLIFAALT